MLDVQPAVLAKKFCQRGSIVGRRIVEYNDQRAVQMTQQSAEEDAYFLLPDIVEVELIVQAQTLSSGTHGDSGNDRDFVAPSLAVIVNRGASLRRPSPGHVRDQEEARFVGEDEVGAQPHGVFFIRGHSCCFHRAMPSSFLSRARRSGFCGLQPKLCISRPTWSR